MNFIMPIRLGRQTLRFIISGPEIPRNEYTRQEYKHGGFVWRFKRRSGTMWIVNPELAVKLEETFDEWKKSGQGISCGPWLKEWSYSI
jgi:hypothetical protein